MNTRSYLVGFATSIRFVYLGITRRVLGYFFMDGKIVGTIVNA